MKLSFLLQLVVVGIPLRRGFRLPPPPTPRPRLPSTRGPPSLWPPPPLGRLEMGRNGTEGGAELADASLVGLPSLFPLTLTPEASSVNQFVSYAPWNHRYGKYTMISTARTRGRSTGWLILLASSR